MSQRFTTASLLALLAATQLLAQGFGDVRHLYDAGKYRETIDTIAAGGAAGVPRPRALYLQAQSFEKLGDSNGAAAVYAQLAGAGPAWQSVAQAALDLQRKQPAEAVAAATQATAQDPELPEARYQLGLAYTVSGDFAKAASAFDKALELDQQWAYAAYYAGLSYYKAKRIDILAARFEAFLKLAPNAPERPEVESIMRTLRGR
jgi:tetratricopeptide (TPR) repeat protein